MVRVTAFLARVPVIKFRKGGLGQSAGAPAATSAPKGCPVSSAPRQQAQPAAGMSTSIPDIDLPARYQRQPLSQEEIDHINGGGIKSPSKKEASSSEPPKALAVLKIPRGVLIQAGKRKEIISMNIVLQKMEKEK